ncbi:response regulator transcription factor [Burkholderia orbicola]|uniref:response regulator transcription factor n=1 Tax=Burkholderia orbicola TaxID=2978683 RepID=UPI002FDFB875
MNSYLNSIRVAILDDHPISALGMASHLTREAGCDIIGAERDAMKFLKIIEAERIDVALVDFMVLTTVGRGIRGIKQNCPGLRVVATSSSSFELVRLASLNSGADGFYGKNEDAERLVRAVMRAASGFRDKVNAAGSVIGGVPFNGLSKCELEVLLSCLEGISIAEIARRKERSIKTVSRQKRLAYQKLGIETDFELFKDERLLRFSNLLGMDGVKELAP